MRKTPLAALLAVLALAGCGSGHQAPAHVTHGTPHPFVNSGSGPVPSPTASTGCEHAEFPGAGDCIKAELHRRGFALRPPLQAAQGSQCVDISRWQGVFNFSGAGLSCVMIQTNDGGIGNPFFWMQAAQARSAHLPFGIYVFVEGGCPSCQGARAYQIAKGSGYSLGGWGDAEQPSAYPVVCQVVNSLHVHFRIVGTYGSPGTYRGGRCQGYNWPACWGSTRKCPLPGYPASAVVLQQWCGTCHLFGREMDRDVSFGLLSLAHPAPPSKHAQLLAATRRRDELLADLHRHGCFHVHGRHAYKLCPRWGTEWRLSEGQIRHLRKEGAR